jgi:uncharacterized UBP type Zn finger protein
VFDFVMTFRFGGPGGKKDFTRMHIENTINMKDFMTEEEEMKYKLKSTVNHIGQTTHSGHYVTYVSNNNGSYFKYDDDNKVSTDLCCSL